MFPIIITTEQRVNFSPFNIPLNKGNSKIQYRPRLTNILHELQCFQELLVPNLKMLRFRIHEKQVDLKFKKEGKTCECKI
jgi:hypothetical protein